MAVIVTVFVFAIAALIFVCGVDFVGYQSSVIDVPLLTVLVWWCQRENLNAVEWL